ncbi:MAG: hypothetical protein AAGJ38_08290 [Planctomycetota bacterium]
MLRIAALSEAKAPRGAVGFGLFELATAVVVVRGPQSVEVACGFHATRGVFGPQSKPTKIQSGLLFLKGL